MYEPTFDPHWKNYYDKLTNELKERVAKKLKKILEFPKKRHMKKSAKFFVDEIGQNRIVYRVFEENNEVRFYFVGNHKEYENWYLQFT
ncbi:MAG TPA: hypothetical protein VFF13_05440 [archaeon]|nr:hypothetical protein [archaeon]